MSAATFSPGDRIRFADDRPYWWEVRAADDRWVVVVRQAPFKAKGVLWYAIVDTQEQIRGACDLIGQGWGDGSYSDTECEELLAALRRQLLTPDERGQTVLERASDGSPTSWLHDDDAPSVGISHRNRVHCDLSAIERRPS